MDYFLVDTSGETYYPRTQGSILLNSPSSSHKAIMWIKGAFNAVNKTKRNDILFCYLDIQAVICWWISILTFRRRNIIAINLLLKDKPTIKNKIVSWMYKKALDSNNFTATVTSPEYGNWLNQKFNRNFKFHHLPDIYIYDNLYDLTHNIDIEENTVFCGGKNGRDWNTMIKIAQEMPEISFKLVMPKNILPNDQAFPSNIKIFEDIPLNQFLKEMCSSKVVCLPLDTEAPAGLIVLFQAAAMEKSIIISNTATTRGYITSNMDGFYLVSGQDPTKWAKSINYALTHKPQNSTQTLKTFLSSNCSSTKYIDRLNKIKSVVIA